MTTKERNGKEIGHKTKAKRCNTLLGLQDVDCIPPLALITGQVLSYLPLLQVSFYYFPQVIYALPLPSLYFHHDGRLLFSLW